MALANAPTTYTGLLVGDTVQVPGGSADGIPSPTLVGGKQVSAVLELQSTLGAFLVPRMTTTQKTALVTQQDGMVVYDTSLGQMSFRENGAWIGISNAGGDVTGPGSSTNTAVALWNGTGGNQLENSTVTIDGNGNIAAGNVVSMSGNGTNTGSVFFWNTGTTFGTYLAGANVTGNITFTLPLAVPTQAGALLEGATSGVLSFNNTVAASPSTLSIYGDNSSVNGVLKLYNQSLSNYVELTPATALSSNLTFTLPTAYPGVNGEILTSDTAGNLSFPSTLITASSNLGIKGNGSIAGGISLYNIASSKFTTIQASGLVASDFTLTLPNLLPNVANAPLVSDTSGNLSFLPGTSFVQYFTTTITSAQILGLESGNGLQVLPAPGANSAYFVQSWGIEVIGGSVGYSGGGNLYLQYGTGTATEASAEISSTVVTMAFSATNEFATAAGTSTVLGTASISNTALRLNNKTTPFTTGNGTAVLHIYYTIVSIT